MAGKHGPNRLSAYVRTHETVMEHLHRGGLVVRHDLVFTPLRGSILIEGLVWCPGEVYVKVEKRLVVREGEGVNALVQTDFYSYNAAVHNVGNIFRYDSPHRTHNQYHHKHVFDLFDRDEDGRVIRLHEEEERPTLGEVIEEAAEWYFENQRALEELRRR